MHSGNFILVLHSHLPWVLHHGRWPHGADWLNEAASECYIPLLNVFFDLLDEGVIPKVTIDISPVLCEQLEHPDFKEMFVHYCDEKIEAAARDEKDFRDWAHSPHQIYLAQFWRNWYEDRKNDFTNKYDKSIIGAMRKLQDAGALEVMTCGATHGYLPLLGFDRSVNLQVKAAVENYKKYFGRRPKGMWLPECAYRPSYEWKSLIPTRPFHEPRLRPGVEQILARNDINYFITDENLTERAEPLGVFLDEDKNKFEPLWSDYVKKHDFHFDKSPLSLFNVSSSEKTEYGTAVALTRHHDIAMQVWSGEAGYPGEPDYLDFHKKRLESKLRYWRVTDNKADMMFKKLYHPDWTADKIDRQSNHFIHHIENTLNWRKNEYGRTGSLCLPFDTELFGHWWFEGPEFIKSVIRGLHSSPYVNSATASEELYRIKPKEIMRLPEGSWGVNNNHDVWSNSDTRWTWEAIYNNELRLSELFKKYPPQAAPPSLRRILTQALRELTLLQSSDWQFLIYTKSAKDYAEQRFAFHHSDFNKLCSMADDYNESESMSFQMEKYLEETEKRNSPFPELQIEWWAEFGKE